MIVVTRVRAPASDAATADSLRSDLEAALAILAAHAGYAGGEIGRNVDDPDLWVLSTRWRNVGSYRALSSYESKSRLQTLLMHALDEPGAYERVDPDTDLNVASSRSLG